MDARWSQYLTFQKYLLDQTQTNTNHLALEAVANRLLDGLPLEGGDTIESVDAKDRRFMNTELCRERRRRRLITLGIQRIEQYADGQAAIHACLQLVEIEKSLDPPDAELLALCAAGYSSSEISDRTGKSPSAVRTKVSRLRQHLLAA